MIYIDERWAGAHGIGRFAMETACRIPHRKLAIAGRPMSPFDSIRLSVTIARQPDISLFFSPGYNAPRWSRVPYVLAVHDLNHIDRPENSSWLKRRFYRYVLKPACQRARFVITVSEFSRHRISEWSGVPMNRIVNVGNGVEASYRPDAGPYRPGYEYVLCVSNRRLHKNEGRLVTAFAAARLPPEMRLLFTGPSEPWLLQKIAAAGLAERVVFLGRVEEQAMPGLYSGAVCLAFPSLYEGFGLPVIEAFACGTPVVTSNVTSLSEVAANAALLVDPTSVGEIASALRNVVSNPALRADLRARGLSRAAAFNWADVAEKLHAVLRAAMAPVAEASA